MRLSSVDLPAFGLPISPTSAITLSSSATTRTLARHALFDLARRPVDGGRERTVPRPPWPPLAMTTSSPSSARSFTSSPVAASRTIVSRRNHQDDVVATLPLPVASLARLARFGDELLVAGQPEQAVGVPLRAEDDTAAVAAVAAAGAPLGGFEFPTERDATVAAIAAADMNRDAVEKHGGRDPEVRGRKHEGTGLATRPSRSSSWWGERYGESLSRSAA